MADEPKTYPAAPDYPFVAQDLYRLLKVADLDPWYEYSHPEPKKGDQYCVPRGLGEVPRSRATGVSNAEVLIRTWADPQGRNHASHAAYVQQVVDAVRVMATDPLADVVLGKHVVSRYGGTVAEGIVDGCWQHSLRLTVSEGRAYSR